MPQQTESGFSRSRRRLLIASGTVACAGVAFGAWSYSERNRAQWIEQVIRSNLPGVALDEPSLQKFIRDTLAGTAMQSQRRRLGIVAHTRVPWLARRIRSLDEGVELSERQVLTDFLMGSNFFRVTEPRQETITYYGALPACGNPFATFV
jgi:hypothetical protein